MARKEGKKAKGAGARALASVAVTLRVTTTPAALNGALQGRNTLNKTTYIIKMQATGALDF